MIITPRLVYMCITRPRHMGIATYVYCDIYVAIPPLPPQDES